MPIRVILADDHQVLRQGVKALLMQHGLEVVAEASDGRAAVEVVREFRPDVAVLDIMMPFLNGIDAAREIARDRPETRVILMTAVEDERYVTTGVQHGVRGFVLKTQAAEDLVLAITEVARGGLYVSPGVSRALVDACKAAAARPSDHLTTREREVVQLVAEGKSTKQIAALLKITHKTAEFHRMRVMKKLDLHDVASLVRYAIREGMIVP